jgi:hypothetical protein
VDAGPAAASRPLQVALRQLLGALDHADNLSRPVWEFAVGRDCLRELGLTDNDLRWLICKGYVEHAIEQTGLKSRKRVFRRIPNLALHDRSCFVLTQAGVAFARRVSRLTRRDPDGKAVSDSRRDEPDHTRALPHWDKHSHTLYWHGKVVKHYKGDAANQEAVLNAFQKGKWASCVLVALPADAGVSAKERLHNTIKNLNRSVRPHVRFRQEGSGSRVRWEPMTATPRKPQRYP